MSNKLADTRADGDNLNDQIKCNRIRLETLKHFFIIDIIPWDPMGWDGMGQRAFPMGRFFLSHPIPFGALSGTYRG